MADPQGEVRRLRWKCRRGMQELDVLLLRWLDRHYAAASESERGAFRLLLDTEDDRLWHWFLGHEHAPDADVDALVGRIRSLPP